jgi:diaminobutyrate-2-oxoglutarate transaminase
MTMHNDLSTFETLESEVRGYIRSFPTVFAKAEGCYLYDESGRRYLDFFAGAGALSYGHNNPVFKKKLIEYIEGNGITHGLDLATTAKRRFLDRFNEVILKPRGLEYRVQFPGPTGTNSVEAAMKLARKVTGRAKMLAFTNAFHGMTLGSLAITGNAFKRSGAGVELTMCVSMPYDGYFEDGTDTIDYMDRLLADQGSGIDLPAAAIVETIQAEGGINSASAEWLGRLADVCQRYGMLLIVDDIQVGCGRTGPFFSFEPYGIKPDIVCLSKSISGYGMPMALTLIKPEHDVWEPGEHNGTFRGNNLAFITATEAIETYWTNDALEKETLRKGDKIGLFLQSMAEKFPEMLPTLKGRGMIQGIDCGVEGLASKICQTAFEKGLVMETAGPTSNVFKLLPPLIIDDAALDTGFKLIEESIAETLQREKLLTNLAV